MSVTVKNNGSTTIDIPGAGLVFDVGEEQTVDYMTEPLSEAVQAGHLDVTSQDVEATMTVGSDGDTVFDLPMDWPGPDRLNLFVGGLVQEYGTDYTVDAAANTLEWLDTDITLEEDDVLVLVGRW